MEPPARHPVDAPAAGERTTAHRSTAGGSRASRHDQAVDRRSTLSSLIAELSAAAAGIADDPSRDTVSRRTAAPRAVAIAAPKAVAPVKIKAPSPLAAKAAAALDERLGLNATPPSAAVAVHLTGHPESEAAESRPAAEPDGHHLLSAQLQAARAEADVLVSRVETEQTARADVERRLADAEDEVRFLRAEVQMSGYSKRSKNGPGPLRRALLAITGKRRPIVPANNPKKDRLGV